MEDVNDNSPVCPSQPLSFSVPENETEHPDIGQLVATDEDSGDNGLLKYTLTDNSIGTFSSVCSSPNQGPCHPTSHSFQTNHA